MGGGRSLRICGVIATLGPGGAEATMVRLTEALTLRGHDCTVLTLSGTDRDFLQLANSVHRVALGCMGDSRGLVDALLANFRRLRSIRRAVLDSRPDVVLSFVDGTNLLTLAALVGTGIPVVVSERIDPRYYPIGAIRTRLRPLLYRWLARAVVVQTRAVREWATEFLPPQRVWVIPNAISIPPKDSLSQFIPPYPDFPPVGPNTIVAMGRLDRQKGFDLLLSAWGRIASDAPEWNLIILGDGPERPALEAQASSLPRVALPGKVHQPAPLLNAAGIFVMSSRFEGFPNALLEAMAVGLPVISTDCPSGPGDIIQSGVNGLLVPVESVDGLEKAMKSLIADESLRRRLSSQAPGSLAWLAPERILPLWEACLEGQPNPQVCSS